MRRTPVALISIVVSAILAGCAGDQQTTAPRAIAPRAASSGALNYLALTCDANAISNISQDAKKYFPNGDPVFSLITDMKNALKTSVVAATPKGFDILARTAEVRRTAKQTGTNVQGGTFVLDVIGCMSVGEVPDTFLPASALGSGIFEVRTEGINQGPTVAYTALTAKSTAAASPEWGAEAASPSAQPTDVPVWPPVTNPAEPARYLVYGYPGSTGVLTSGFELSTLPVPKDIALTSTAVDISANPLAVGVCTASAVTTNTGKKAANLLNHNGTVLPLQKLNFCNTNFTVTSSSYWLRSLPGRFFALVKPTTLFAQDEETRFVGGLPSGWTPNIINQFVSTDITLSYFKQPVDAKLSTDMVEVIVEAKTTATDPLPPLNVRLTIANNSGQPAFLTTTLGGTGVSFVDKPVVCSGSPVHCLATFSIGFTKAGGYTLTAVGYIGGGSVGTAAVISNLFNVKNQ